MAVDKMFWPVVRSVPMRRTRYNLKGWMAANRYSVRTLAAAVGVSPSTVQEWRNAGEMPQVVVLALASLEGPQKV